MVGCVCVPDTLMQQIETARELNLSVTQTDGLSNATERRVSAVSIA
jgi:hypothetical protein